MLTKLKITPLLAAVALFTLASCERIKDDYENCGVWLTFIFDHNMEYADTFEESVGRVDVMVFDAAGKYVRTDSADTDELDGRRRMWLTDLPFGTYTVLTAGDHTDEHFEFKGATLDEAVIALKAASASSDFPHLYFGPPVEVEYVADMRECEVHLIRQSNRFDITLVTADVDVPDGTEAGAIDAMHTVEIETPESGSYDKLNQPLLLQQTLYHPHSLSSSLDYVENAPTMVTSAKINTMRLLEEESDGYRIVVRDIASGEELLGQDLLPLLADRKPDFRPDGSVLPLAEYLDREGEWKIDITYGPGDLPDPAGGFVALMIRVNGWIVWQQGMDL